MTTENKTSALQSVTEKIVKVVPEIRGNHEFLKMEGGDIYCWKCNLIEDGTLYEECIRPITLEDVLRASTTQIVRKDKIPINVTCLGIDNLGRMFQLPMDVYPNCVLWLLGKPLSKQSEETLQFLDSLLP
jgi:hypothetical protein